LSDPAATWHRGLDGDRILEGTVRAGRVVCLAGMPGVGKSLILRRAVELAEQHGRRVHLLQWDIARLAFDAEPYSARYPEVDGVTHPAIRRAAGVWARRAVGRWYDATPPGDVLLAETPLLGNRFLELAATADDRDEARLSGEQTRFVVLVPSARVRDAIVSARARDSERPRTLNERKSAGPDLIAAQWSELLQAADHLKLRVSGSEGYDPELYWHVYARILNRRHCSRLSIDTVLAPPADQTDAAGIELLPSRGDVQSAFDVVGRTPMPEIVEQVTNWPRRV
jgi:hypothetical protein